MLYTLIRPLFALVVTVGLASGAFAQSSYQLFESGPVRPVALTPDQTRLLVTNIPDGRLEIFSVAAGGNLAPLHSVPVGLEPVTVEARTNTEAWVVNHLSDSVSIVDLSASPPRVVRTLLVGDEPRDLVFANGLAFITTAHRGQQRTDPSVNSARNAGSDDGDPEFISPGVNRADVWVFDTADLDQGAASPVFGGVPLEIVTFFGDTPRALAVNGNTVYAAVFHSGNQTTTVSEGMVCDGFNPGVQCPGDGETSPNGLVGGNLPGGNAGPSTNDDGVEQVTAPEVGLIVKYDPGSGEWRDEGSRNWSNGVRFNLPDLDVFAIDATTCGDVDGCDLTQTYAGVGSILFNMVVNPSNGRVYVSNTDSQNLTRFEGPGGGGSTVQGNLAQSRITVLEPGGAVKPRHVNQHINYSTLPAPAGVKDHSLATPVQMAITADGATLYVAAFGSSKVGVIATADLDNDARWDQGGAGDDFDPTTESANYISVSGGGPAGLALKQSANRLYVLTRFDNKVVIVNTLNGSELGSLPLYDAEPASVTNGRFMLYDAQRTSSNGEASCASCHIFGDLDSIGWDLGDPDGSVTANPQPINLVIAAGDQNGGAANDEFHPMKGPMTTQTLRGLATSGHMHWRGDRTTGFFGSDDPHTNDSVLSFNNFIVAFPGLVGLDTPPTDPQLQLDMFDFTSFALQLRLPPNPVRALDNSLNTQQALGKSFYLGNGPGRTCADGFCIGGNTNTGIGFTCEGCHTLDPMQGFFGTGGNASFENEKQIFKVAHLRNLYQKIGMFGMPNVPFNNSGDNLHKGDQIRGFGFLHDGSTDTIFRFFQATVFNDAGGFADAGFSGDPQRRDMEQFMLAFDTDLAPAVGQQVTLRQNSIGDTVARIALLIARAEANFTSAVLGGAVKECDLVVKGSIGGAARGWLYDTQNHNFTSDAAADAPLTDAALRALVTLAEDVLTYTCAPPGSGKRLAVDRDEDDVLDFDEVIAQTNPANPGSLLGACSDTIDNDGDGLIDIIDPGCNGSNAGNNENPQCADGVDNDGDGLVDLADPHCANSGDDTERLKKKACGLGLELAFLLPGILVMRRRRSVKG